MWVSRVTEEDLTNDVIDRLLFEGLNDTGASVGCIVVLGSKRQRNIEFLRRLRRFFLEGLKR